jgi:PilZ domain
MNENLHYREDPLADAFGEPGPADEAISTSESGDRRRAPRFAPLRRCTVECSEGVMSVFGWGQPHVGLTLLDHSLGGVRLASREPLKPGAVVRLDLGTDGVEGVEAFGEVRWSRRVAGQYLTGIQFFDLPADKADEMRTFLELIRHPADALPHA